VVRKLQIVQMRGQAQVPGLHTVKISDAGVRVYSRLPNPYRPKRRDVVAARRGTGVSELDAMLGGGIPSGYSVMIVGPSGSGKTILSTQFIREGISQGERAVIAVFEKRPDEYLTTAPGAKELGRLVEDGSLTITYLRPLDLSVDETMEELASVVQRTGAKRLVIDSLMGLELALAPSFREDFRESLYRMVGGLVDLGVTIVMTAEIVDSYSELRLSPREISFLTDGIILQRYVELDGQIKRVIAVAKMRGSAHSTELRLYTIDSTGITVGKPMTGYDGVLVGHPHR
jgi:circadian clock protein KaiC